MPLTWEEVETADPRDFNLKTAPDRFREVGYSHGAMEAYAGDLAQTLELSVRQAMAGETDAPHRTSRRAPTSRREYGRSKRRKSIMPLIEIARAKEKEDALVGVERWKSNTRRSLHC